MTAPRTLLTGDDTFSLAETCAPAAWAKGRWPNLDWIDESLIWVGWEAGRISVRRVTERAPGQLEIAGERDATRDTAWARDVLGWNRRPVQSSDPVVSEIACRFPGMRPFASGSLFDGLVSSIVGQSITVMAAAVTEARLAALFGEGVQSDGRRFWPLPTPEHIAGAPVEALRGTGMTWKRAEAIAEVARLTCSGGLPDDAEARSDPARARARMLELSGVGPWTAESALLWGLGADDAFPPNDAALLRAVRRAFTNPEIDHRGLIRLSSAWSPGRAWACRWLWLDLLGVAPTVVSP